LKPQNLNLSASFPDAAKLFSAAWSAGPGNGVQPDGVVSIDPVALGDLLSVLGSVTTSNGFTLTSSNAADVLLRKQYYTYAGVDQAPRVAFLGQVTTAVFARVTKGDYPPAALGRRLAKGVAEGRILVWSADPANESAWQSLGAAGELGEPAPELVRFALNSLDGSKLGAYLHTSVLAAACGSAAAQLNFTFTSDAPADLPWYAGTHISGVSATTMKLGYSLYIAPQWGISRIAIDGKRQGFTSATEAGWRLVRGTVEIRPGTTVKLAIQLTGARGVPALRSVVVEPQAHEVPTHVASDVGGASASCATYRAPG
jgi:hypothetical protein